MLSMSAYEAWTQHAFFLKLLNKWKFTAVLIIVKVEARLQMPARGKCLFFSLKVILHSHNCAVL